MHLQVLLLLPFLFAVSGEAAVADESCQNCHGNFQLMSSLGRRDFSFSSGEIQSQTGMDATCSQCHLGNPKAMEKSAAHIGLLRLLVVSKNGLVPITSARKTPLGFGSNQTNRLFATLEKAGKPTKDTRAASLSWHDKRTDTLSQDFEAMGKTCGACHRQEFEEFTRSTMGTNAKQKQYGGWVNPQRGPHNCGPWFDGNFDSMQEKTAVSMSRESHMINQKVCNTCHVGCLDCHYLPQMKNPADYSKGMHTFVKTPPAESCYGNGRASICHAGPEDRRRGAGYFGGSFSFPEGNEPDVHLKAKVGCLDCHDNSKTNPKIGHAMVRRQAQESCQRCHADVVKSHALSLHRNLACESCHIGRIAGYQGTFWGPGTIAGADTPYFKYKAYYGYMSEPVLIRDQKGRWIPVKPFPMAVMNQKGEPPFRPGLYWRYPADLPDLQRTDDAWGYVGYSDALPENNRAMLWIQMDKLSHKLGKSRPCSSCHESADGSQIRKVKWEYSDPGAMPFNGSHQVRADSQGLYIENIRSEPIQPEKGFSLSAFAPWMYLGDSWKIRGDFAIPLLKEHRLYEEIRKEPAIAGKRGVVHK
jgi:hypothetical protein